MEQLQPHHDKEYHKRREVASRSPWQGICRGGKRLNISVCRLMWPGQSVLDSQLSSDPGSQRAKRVTMNTLTPETKRTSTDESGGCSEAQWM